RGGKFAAMEAIEEEEDGNVTADRPGLEAGERPQPVVDLGMPGDPVRRQIQHFEAVQEMGISIAFPSRPDAAVKLPPNLMVFFRIQRVILCNVKVSAIAGLFYKRGVAGGEPGCSQCLGHASLLPAFTLAGNREP